MASLRDFNRGAVAFFQIVAERRHAVALGFNPRYSCPNKYRVAERRHVSFRASPIKIGSWAYFTHDVAPRLADGSGHRSSG